jgi:serine phosphatase RsbU (regulator of sigma subunit)
VLATFAPLTTAAGLVLAGLAVYVARRRGRPAGVSLAVLLVSVAWWGLAYAVELSVTGLDAKSHWGDLKYVGIVTFVPAWLVFVLQYTGRGDRVTRRLVLALLVEPLVVLTTLANGATHDLVRFYPAAQAGESAPIVSSGPVFWGHLVYANALLLFATGVFVATMVRLSRLYRRVAVISVAAALLPYVANLLYNFEVGWFAHVDLTPFAFTVTGGVLVWGLFRERLVNLSPLARSVIVETMTDGVFVLDAFGRVADANRAGAGMLGRAPGELVGLVLRDLLPEDAYDAPTGELTLGQGEDTRSFDVRRQPLADRGDRPSGQLVVLRDITERVHDQRRLRELLAERSRVASALQASLIPTELPAVPCTEVASRFEPAGDGSEVGGDFFDVFPLDQGAWGIVLGDISGKGAEAAAVTALVRYTLRALADARNSPSRTLQQLNAKLLATRTLDRHCTLVYMVARPTRSGLDLTLSLAGHHPPLVRYGFGQVMPVGRLGTALGLLEDPELYDAAVSLSPGELVCMFTDGLVEARSDGELFGAERVAEVIATSGERPDDVAAALVAAARDFAHCQDLADDLALLVLRAEAADSLSLDG